jgi:hypothetical protein
LNTRAAPSQASTSSPPCRTAIRSHEAPARCLPRRA